MPEQWIAVGSLADLKEGAMKDVDLGEKQLAIYNVGGEIYATDGMCTHAYAMLTDGFLDGDIVECPLHAGCFNVKTGAGLGPPITENLKTYPVRVAGDNIEVNVG